ncbi:hypothetical protein [Tenacibaculum maritimum]|uniref:hypothetical protein n=1 Tax=Tenacibaculum maritimum TaxID=107401 RepID=UPI001E54052C|nr:hypothetical protein [Tenacibaculum maritimum]MCD9621878.1 hypothetical protein [Tenacibaculum maritimum]MCD9628248.1 hypothetical protein [Tenacibaculum maritimum]MCD9631070.1 hypothetical protein [Tenacibaculum maritimum]MCD9634060.1 hypothetical protein [Tenacibaculum maritimum]
MKIIRVVLAAILVITTMSCKKQSNQKAIKQVEVKTDTISPVKKVIKKNIKTPESKLNGKYKIDLLIEDKNRAGSTRYLDTQRLIVSQLSRQFKFSFDGKGNGTNFHSDKYLTKKQVKENTFKYKIIKNSVYIVEKGQKQKIFDILDESVRGDYYKIQMGEYKVGFYKI